MKTILSKSNKDTLSGKGRNTNIFCIGSPRPNAKYLNHDHSKTIGIQKEYNKKRR